MQGAEGRSPHRGRDPPQLRKNELRVDGFPQPEPDHQHGGDGDRRNRLRHDQQREERPRDRRAGGAGPQGDRHRHRCVRAGAELGVVGVAQAYRSRTAFAPKVARDTKSAPRLLSLYPPTTAGNPTARL